MGRRKTDDFENEESDYFDELEYEEDSELNLDSDYEEEYDSASPILDEISIADIVNEYGIDGFADAVIDSISYSDLEKLRDRINEYLE